MKKMAIFLLTSGLPVLAAASTPINQLHVQQPAVTQQQIPTPVQPAPLQQYKPQPLQQYKPQPRPQPVEQAQPSDTRPMPYQDCLNTVTLIGQGTHQIPAVIERTPTLQKFRLMDGMHITEITCDQSKNSMKMEVKK